MTPAASPTAATAPWELDRTTWAELSALLSELEDRLDAKEAAVRRQALGGFADAGPLPPPVTIG